ncbi:MAG: DUF6046 domain-containing protein, partial [Muribaculaceae bacterium]
MDRTLAPISFEFIAAGIARRARLSLTQLTHSQVNTQIPSWDGHDGDIATMPLMIPITDVDYWDGRYVLTKIKLRRADGQILNINDATVAISLEKQIVRTSLVGLNGTIKEYICDGDYDIGITVGIVAVKDGQIVDEYPEQGIREVKKFLSDNQSIEVSSVFFDIFGIN